MSAAVGDGIAAKPLRFNPAGMLAVRGFHFNPFAIDVEGNEGELFRKAVGDSCLGRRVLAQRELLTSVVACSHAQHGAVDPVAAL